MQQQVWEEDFRRLGAAGILLVIDHARAGNGFFKRIFDQHAEVLTIAVISYLYHALQPLFGGRTTVPWQEAVSYWVAHTNFSFIGRPLTEADRAAYKARGNDPQSHIDREQVGTVFEHLLRASGQVTRRDVILATHAAYLHGTGRPKRGYTHILLDDSVVGPEDAFVLRWLQEDFPSARVIHLVRDPRANFASLRHQIVNQYGCMYPLKAWNLWRSIGSNAVWLWILKYTAQGAREMERWRDTLPATRFYRIRNEDLNLEFVATVRKLTEWLGVTWHAPWDDSSWAPTADGIPWEGASAYSGDFKPGLNGPLENERSETARYPGPHRRNTERWKERVTRSEIALLERVYDAEMRSLNYPKLTSSVKQPSLASALAAPLLGEVPGRKWLFRLRKERWLKDLVIRLTYFPLLPLTYLHSRLMFLFLYKTGRLATRHR